MSIILGYNNYFENAKSEIEEKAQKLLLFKEQTIADIKNKIENDKNYEFWFLISNLKEICFYDNFLGPWKEIYDKINQIKKTKIFDTTTNDFAKNEIKILIDEETYFDFLKKSNETINKKISDIFSTITQHYLKKENNIFNFEKLLTEKCLNCKLNILCNFTDCIKIKEVNEETKKECR